MQIKRASSLIISLESEGITVHNFITRKIFCCNAECLTFLQNLGDWVPVESICDYFPGYSRDSVSKQLQFLLEHDALIIENTPTAKLDGCYANTWMWGTVGGFFHFSVRNQKYLHGEDQRAWLRKRRTQLDSPPLLASNAGLKKTIPLPEMDMDTALFSTMVQRRSIREFEDTLLPLPVLADCLFSAKGVTGYYSDPDFGTLPLTMTPSGGARNPYELYVYARTVNDLETGLYHYSGLDHDLGLIASGEIPVRTMLGGQDWAEGANAIVFLVANFSRSAWKYHLAPAYRVVLMEAGCVIQNIALTATHYGLTAVPTGALQETLIEQHLKTRPVEESAILAIALGKPRIQDGSEGKTVPGRSDLAHTGDPAMASVA